MSTVGYVSHAVEIEDDVTRLRRRKVEFDCDAARYARSGRPRRRRGARGLVSAMPAAVARWR